MKGSKASFSRRLFLTRGAVLGAAAAVGTVSSADGRTIRGELPWAPGGTDPPTPVTGKETHAFFIGAQHPPPNRGEKGVIGVVKGKRWTVSADIREPGSVRGRADASDSGPLVAVPQIGGNCGAETAART